MKVVVLGMAVLIRLDMKQHVDRFYRFLGNSKGNTMSSNLTFQLKEKKK